MKTIWAILHNDFNLFNSTIQFCRNPLMCFSPTYPDGANKGAEKTPIGEFTNSHLKVLWFHWRWGLRDDITMHINLDSYMSYVTKLMFSNRKMTRQAMWCVGIQLGGMGRCRGVQRWSITLNRQTTCSVKCVSNVGRLSSLAIVEARCSVLSRDIAAQPHQVDLPLQCRQNKSVNSSIVSHLLYS